MASYLLALTFGLLISALLHFVLVWPAREPAEDAGDAAGGPDAAGSTPADTAGNAQDKAPAPRRRSSRRRR